MEKANAISSRPMLFVCCAIVILVVLGLCWNSGYFDSNRTIAAFTAMLVITSTLQWWTYHRQWQQMRIASEQTDQIIEHMRNEQRPWLAVKKPEIYYARNEDEAKFQFDLTNHGRTPCAVLQAFYGIGFDADRDTAMSSAKLRLSECNSNEGSVIAPEATAEAVAVFPIKWTEEQLTAMTPGELCIFIAGKILYGEAGEVKYETSFMFGTKTAYNDELIVAGGPAENYMS